MLTKTLTNIEMQGDTIALTGPGFETKIDYNRISTLDISLKNEKIAKQSATPARTLADIEFEDYEYLHVYLVVAGTVFHFDVTTEQGKHLAFRAAIEATDVVNSSASLPEETKTLLEKLRPTDINDPSYPIHFHKMFDDDVPFKDQGMLAQYLTQQVPVLKEPAS
jgi:hypothetical protein